MPCWLRKIWTKIVWSAKHLDRIVRAVEPVVIIIAILAFSIELGDRREERTVRAWQLLTTRAPGNSGKIAALEYLNSETHWFFRSWWPFSKERLPLTGIDLTPPILAEQWKQTPKKERKLEGCAQLTYLRTVELPNANLNEATLVCADLQGANLQGAFLWGADLRGALLRGADLREAHILGAKLQGALLLHADLRGVHIRPDPKKFTILGMDLQLFACPQLTKAKNWETAYRDEELACGQPIPKAPPQRQSSSPSNVAREENRQLQTRDFKAAIDSDTKAIELNPSDAIAYHNRGVTKSHLGQYQAALVDFDRAIELNPAYALAYRSRGAIKGLLGRIDEAREDYQKAIDLAKEAGNEDIVTIAEDDLRRLNNNAEP